MTPTRVMRKRKGQLLIPGFFTKYAEDNDLDNSDSSYNNENLSDTSMTDNSFLKSPKVIKSKTTDDICSMPMSDYERARLKKLEQNRAALMSMGVTKAHEELEEVLIKKEPVSRSSKKKTPQVKRTPSFQDLPRREPSRRLANRAPLNLNEDNLITQIKTEVKEEYVDTDDRTLDSLSMKVEQEESLDVSQLFGNLKGDSKFDPDICLSTCDIKSFTNSVSCFRLLEDLPKAVNSRIQSIYVHPTTQKRLVIAGSVSGCIGIWDIDIENTKGLLQFEPHRRAVNCISASHYDMFKIYTTSHDGTLLCADIEKGVFNNLYATDYSTKIKHLTWHDELDANTLLLAHGNGTVGVIDIRDKERNVPWFYCYDKSVRTVQHHPLNDKYFLVSSGTAACGIFDLRNMNGSSVCELEHPKGLTSAFFSAKGNRVLTTCNDDNMRIIDISHPSKDEFKELKKVRIAHNNHTGRWLSVFKAMWYPGREDAFVTGSLMSPRRVQIYGEKGSLLTELRDEAMTTITPVISIHPTLPLIAGGNSSGRIHVFTASST